MILAHPVIEKSIGNKIISTNFSKEEHIEVRHLDELYPDFNIDVQIEQEALLAADTIVFQFPLFWYNMPAMLKHWIDKVFEYGFAFGKGSKLAGKSVIVSFTIGSPVSLYPDEIVQKIVFPFKGLAEYCKLNYIGEIFCNDINGYSDEAKENAIDTSNKHAQKLLELINQ